MSTAAPVRVLHVVHQFHPGGMEYGVIKLVNGLASRSHVQSAICSTSPAHPAMTSLLSPAVRLVQLARRKGNDPLLVWNLLQLFRRERPDIVHTHGWGTLVEGLVAARAARVPVLMHGEHGTLQLRPYQVHVQRWAWGHVDALLSVSSRLAERMSHTVGVPLDRIHVLRNGVDLARFGQSARAAARADLGVSQDEVLVGHAGRLVDVKDQKSLLSAAAMLKQQGLRVRVVLAGDGPLRSALEAQVVELGIGASVMLLGHRPDVERLYAALDVYVLCSRSEGMPNTILEAMAAAVPVVATRVGGVDELVVPGETGLLVPPGQADALADAIAQLVSQPERRATMALAARQRVELEFSLASVISRYEALYLRLARAPRGPGSRSW